MSSTKSPPLTLLLCLALAACAPKPDVVIYCALDQVHAEPIIRRFEAQTGLKVQAEFDVEAHKTVGLVRRIREESGSTRCDVFWNNEFAHTVAMAEDGLLASYDSPAAADIPPLFRDEQHRWTGFAARARILSVNTDLADPTTIHGMDDLLDAAWRGRVGMARPLTGTTLTHMALLFPVLGEERARAYLSGIIDAGVNLTSGNATLMRLVREGELAFGWTDTDDFNVAREAGYPVAAVYPDQETVGTLLIPNTVCILERAPHPEAARRLVDFILSPEIEATLAAARSAQIPVRASVSRPPHVRSAADMRVMEVDYAALGTEVDHRLAELRERFLR
jgi:iron(III) transport system substrate-binding protein